MKIVPVNKDLKSGLFKQSIFFTNFSSIFRRLKYWKISSENKATWIHVSYNHFDIILKKAQKKSLPYGKKKEINNKLYKNFSAKGQILSTANVLFAEMCAFQIAIEAGQLVISLSTRPKVNMILFSTILFAQK